MIIEFEGQRHEFPDDATDADISAALGQMQPAQPSMSAGGVAADVGKSLAVGVPKGLISLAGTPGDVAELGARGIDLGVQTVGNLLGLDVGPPRAAREPTYGSADIRKAVEGVTGPLYEPKSTAGKYAQTVGEFLPAAAVGPGGIARRVATQAVAPGLASEAAGQATEGTAFEPVARVGAALVAPAAARRAITPFPADAGRGAMLRTLEAEGVPLTAGQRTGSKALQYAESQLGDFPLAGNKATKAQEAQQQSFVRAALKRIGMDAPPTPANLDAAVTGLSNKIESLAARNTLVYDRPFVADVNRTLNRYLRKLPSQQREVINNYIDDFTNLPGRMPGDVYQITRSDLSRQAFSARNSDPTFADALRGLKDALDDAMRRSISPKDAAEWKDALRKWGNWKTIERAAGSVDASGNITFSPAALQQAVRTGRRGAYARGKGDFAGLAQAGASVMKPLPQSGTTPRAVATGLMSTLAGAAGGFPAAAAAIGLPAVAGRGLLSRPVQSYLGNQAMLPPANLPLSTGLLPLLALQHPQQQPLSLPR